MSTIDHFNLRNFDLNLLITFDALYEERSVTKAAGKLRVQQPAMSHGLAALRMLMQDALFVRTNSGLEPTARANLLAPLVREILKSSQEALFHKTSFSARDARGTFRIGVNFQFELLVIPRLLSRLRQEAPHIRLITSPVSPQSVYAMLDNGLIDLAIGFIPGGQSWHGRQNLGSLDHVLCFEPNLVGRNSPLTIEDYQTLPLAFVSARNNTMGYLESELARLNVKADVFMTSPHVLTILECARQAAVIATISRPAASRYCAEFGLVVHELPFNLQPIEVDMVWHARAEGDAANAWLREQLLSVARRELK